VKSKKAKIQESEFMQMTDKQTQCIKSAIELLKPFNKEDVSSGLVYFRKVKDQDELGSEYDCCDNEKCVKETLKYLRKKCKGSRFEDVYTLNDGDHDGIGRCFQCSRPLNEFMTWVQEELSHWEGTYLTKKRLWNSSNSFDLIAMFESMPSMDESMSDYDKHQADIGNYEPWNDTIKDQRLLVKRVVNVAKRVIKNINCSLLIINY